MHVGCETCERTGLLKLFPSNMCCGMDGIEQHMCPTLRASLAASIWSSVKEHRSVKFEVGALACVRFWLKRARTVVLGGHRVLRQVRFGLAFRVPHENGEAILEQPRGL